MFKRAVSAFLLFLFILSLVGCAAHIHKVGDGPQGDEMIQKRQWYVLWGLVPINDVDTAEMAKGVEDYKIRTEQSVLDVIINCFTGVVTVYSRTVTVTK